MESRNFKGIEIKFSEGNHRYYVNDNGTKINPNSVSKIIKPGNEFSIGAFAGRKNYIETMIEELPKDDLFKDIPLIDLQEKLFECKKMAENKWTDQALIGSAVHDWIEGYLKNNMAEQGYYKGHDERANHIRKLQYPMYEYLNKNIREVHATEQLVYDNSILPYAGKFDAWIDHAEHGECLVDWKTVTKKSNGKLWRIQLCGYMMAICNERNIDPFNRLIVAIDKETYTIQEHLYDVDSYAEDLQIWKNYLQIHSFLSEKK